ncbi:hypothetical protein ACPW96_02345 [Micromonospora sp. DT81.3]|uniref:hypothetical protein n=1 Tax=Micromonospora sp. DT81.3 TaxID=3416523 RepID=UPI003CEA6D8C
MRRVGDRRAGTTLTAGVARAAITPARGVPMSGFVGRGPALDIHDDLFATALVLAERGGQDLEADTRVAIVALDLIGMYSDELVATLKAAVRRATGIPPERVFLACSHTHYGPVVAENGDMPGGETSEAAEYRARLPTWIARCVAEADSRREPVTLFAGRGACRVGVNRREPQPDGTIALGRNPDGPLDPEVQILRFDRTATDAAGDSRGDPATVATIVSFACHPSSLEASVRSISADFPGAMRARVEQVVGGTALFLQGAAGDIDPKTRAPDWSLPESFGLSLATEAIRASSAAQHLAATPLTSERRRLAIPRRGADSVSGARSELEGLLADMAARGSADPDAGWWLELKIKEAREVLAALESGRRPTIEADISVLRIGDAALSFAPAELFTELGRAIKIGSPSVWTGVVGYTDGALWYVPTRAAYDEGGYEVNDACRVPPEAGELLVERTVALLEQVFARG